MGITLPNNKRQKELSTKLHEEPGRATKGLEKNREGSAKVWEGLSRTIYIDAQEAQDFFLNGHLVFPGIGKSAANHRLSRLPVQEALVVLILCILCILCIHVHKTKKGSQGVGPDCLGSCENGWDLEADPSA